MKTYLFPNQENLWKQTLKDKVAGIPDGNSDANEMKLLHYSKELRVVLTIV